MKTRVLLISDIGFQINQFRTLFAKHECHRFAELTVHCSPGSGTELTDVRPAISELSLKDNIELILKSFDLVVSYHSRQLFPREIVKTLRCVNIHPGFNPFNKGWYPGVFSISNGLPTGATIHEIDERIDHGPIIAQKQIEIVADDTSGTVYPKIIAAENELLETWFMPILQGDYETFVPKEEGNLNFKADYYRLQQLDLSETLTMKQALDRLRALTHPPFKNAYFIDPENGDRIYVSVEMKRERKPNQAGPSTD